MFDSRVMGVDPGLSRCGVAVLDGPARRASTIAVQVVRTPAQDSLGERLAAIHGALADMLRTHRPAHLAVERVFINAQAQTGVGAAQVVGLVHLLGATHDVPVAEFTPSQVKAAVTGVGDADKEQVTYMVQRMLRLADPPRPADKADALAVALCQLQQSTLGAGAAHGGLPHRLAQAVAQAGPGLQRLTPTPAPRRQP